MIIKHMEVSGLEWAILRSGNPKRARFECKNELGSGDTKRASDLGSAARGSGHDCFLKGITVAIDAYIMRGILLHLERYRFVDIVSSTSLQHCLKEILYDDFCMSRVDREMLSWLRSSFESKGAAFTRKHMPDCVLMGVSFRTNYLALKTIVSQRRFHYEEDWREFCTAMILELPMFQELTGIQS